MPSKEEKQKKADLDKIKIAWEKLIGVKVEPHPDGYGFYAKFSNGLPQEAVIQNATTHAMSHKADVDISCDSVPNMMNPQGLLDHTLSIRMKEKSLVLKKPVQTRVMEESKGKKIIRALFEARKIR